MIDKKPRMHKQRYLAVFAVICLVAVLVYGLWPRWYKYQASRTGLFNTEIIFTAYARNERAFTHDAEIVFDELERLHILFDAYNAYDGVNNLYTINANAGTAPVAVDASILALLKLGQTAYDETDGAVNIAMGPVTALWRQARERAYEDPANATEPDAQLLREAVAFTDISRLVIDEQAGTVYMAMGMRLDVGALAKGFAVECAMRKAAEAGMVAGLLDAGGNVAAVGEPKGGNRDRWLVGVADPVAALSGENALADTLFVRDIAVVSSGGYERFYIVDGQRYGHIIDPETLMPPTRYAGVTVLHPDAGIADMLSTALFILPRDAGEALTRRYNAEVVWFFPDGYTEATEGYYASVYP